MSAMRSPVSAERALATAEGRVSGRWLGIWLAAVAVGAAGFGTALGSVPQRAWMSVWMNFLFWTSLAVAGVVFGAVLQAAKGHWGKEFRRLAEAAGAFLPVSFVLFLLLRLGAGEVLPWTGTAELERVNATWLNLDIVFSRDAVLLLILYGVAFAFLWYSLRADAPLVAEHHTGWRRALTLRLARGWRGDEVEVERCRSRLGRLAPLLILTWAIVSTVLSFDLIMSLVPGFLSVVWGPYFFVGGWLCMLALVAIMANHHNRRHGEAPLWGEWEFHDLGKLMFAFVIFWTYLWFSQFLVIWYGNLPHEVSFFVPRTRSPFTRIYWTQMVLIFGLPFLFLLGRKPKMRPRWLAFVACLILIGFWIERYNLVVPSVWQGDHVPIGAPEVLISVGFLGLFGLSYALFASTFPKLPLRETLAVGRARHGP
ncbi:MAG: hypothetical protein ACE5HQ_07050 [Gemmatimonadota bacterium]